MRTRRFGSALTLVLLAALGASGCAPGGSEVAELGYAGRLVFTQGTDGLWQIVLESGQMTQLWNVPEGGALSGVAVSPDGEDLALAYAAPNPSSPIPRSDIYLANGDGSNPEPLLEHRGLYESFTHPVWSPDGHWIYFSRSDVVSSEDGTTTEAVVNVERVAAGGGEPELFLANAEQLSFSEDGSRIAYLSVDPEVFTRGLWVANADGSNPTQILADAAFLDLTSPRLSPDGQMVAFAASGPIQPGAAMPSTFWDWMLGVEVAYAHGLPWDYWTIPTSGGPPTKITDLGTDGTALAWGPNDSSMALMHIGGLFLWEGGELVMLAETPNHGGLDWSLDD